MDFTGFSPADLEIFSIPTFAERMGAIRGQLRPKLVALGAELAPEIAHLAGQPIFPHAAAHMRRRVNPPPETWIAYARDARGYKRWTHYRVSVSDAGVRVVVFVEDDADDKPVLAEGLARNATAIAKAGELNDVLWYSAANDGAPPPATGSLGAKGIRALGESLARLKTEKFVAGIWLTDTDAFAPPGRLCQTALTAMEHLRPLYLCGVREGYRQ